MSAAAARPLDPAGAQTLTLPPFGALTNGRSALSWVPLADLPTGTADRLLTLLADRGIAACKRPRRASGRRGATTATAAVWVDVVGYAVAEDVLRAVVKTHAGTAVL